MDQRLWVKTLVLNGQPMLHSIVERFPILEDSDEEDDESKMAHVIQKKYHDLYQDNPQYKTNSEKKKEPDIQMLPIELYQRRRTANCRRNLFFKTLHRGDILYLQVINTCIPDSYKLLVLAKHEVCMKLEDLSLVMYLPKLKPEMKFIRGQLKKLDLIRAALWSCSLHEKKLFVTLDSTILEEDASVPLGRVYQHELPRYTKCSKIGTSYVNYIHHTKPYYNPRWRKQLHSVLGYEQKHIYSFFTGWNGKKYPLPDYGYELKKETRRQASNVQCSKALDLFEEGKVEATIQYLNEAIQIYPENVQALVCRGTVHAKAKDLRNAFVDTETALKIDPTFEPARKQMSMLLVTAAKAHLSKGNALKAQEALNISRGLDETNTEAADTLRNANLMAVKSSNHLVKRALSKGFGYSTVEDFSSVFPPFKSDDVSSGSLSKRFLKGIKRMKKHKKESRHHRHHHHHRRHHRRHHSSRHQKKSKKQSSKSKHKSRSKSKTTDMRSNEGGKFRTPHIAKVKSRNKTVSGQQLSTIPEVPEYVAKNDEIFAKPSKPVEYALSHVTKSLISHSRDNKYVSKSLPNSSKDSLARSSKEVYPAHSRTVFTTESKSLTDYTDMRVSIRSKSPKNITRSVKASHLIRSPSLSSASSIRTKSRSKSPKHSIPRSLRRSRSRSRSPKRLKDIYFNKGISRRDNKDSFTTTHSYVKNEPRSRSNSPKGNVSYVKEHKSVSLNKGYMSYVQKESPGSRSNSTEAAYIGRKSRSPKRYSSSYVRRSKSRSPIQTSSSYSSKNRRLVSPSKSSYSYTRIRSKSPKQTEKRKNSKSPTPKRIYTDTNKEIRSPKRLSNVDRRSRSPKKLSSVVRRSRSPIRFSNLDRRSRSPKRFTNLNRRSGSPKRLSNTDRKSMSPKRLSNIDRRSRSPRRSRYTARSRKRSSNSYARSQSRSRSPKNVDSPYANSRSREYSTHSYNSNQVNTSSRYSNRSVTSSRKRRSRSRSPVSHSKKLHSSKLLPKYSSPTAAISVHPSSENISRSQSPKEFSALYNTSISISNSPESVYDMEFNSAGNVESSGYYIPDTRAKSSDRSYNAYFTDRSRSRSPKPPSSTYTSHTSRSRSPIPKTGHNLYKQTTSNLTPSSSKKFVNDQYETPYSSSYSTETEHRSKKVYDTYSDKNPRPVSPEDKYHRQFRTSRAVTSSESHRPHFSNTSRTRSPINVYNPYKFCQIKTEPLSPESLSNTRAQSPLKLYHSYDSSQIKLERISPEILSSAYTHDKARKKVRSPKLHYSAPRQFSLPKTPERHSRQVSKRSRSPERLISPIISNRFKYNSSSDNSKPYDDATYEGKIYKPRT